MEHIEQAVYETVHSSEVPAKRIASFLGMSYQVLINKANPQCETHKLSLLEAAAIQRITKSRAIERAFRLDLHQELTEEPAEHFLQATLHFNREVGDVVRSIEEAAKDGKFTAKELELCMKEMDEVEQSIERLRSSLLAQSQGFAALNSSMQIRKRRD